MIRYKSKTLSVEIDGFNESLSASVDALERIIRLSSHEKKERPKMPESVAKYVPVTEPANSVLTGNTSMERSMKRKRIPNVVDLKELEITRADSYEGFRCPECYQSAMLFLTPGNSSGDKGLVLRTAEGIRDLKGVDLIFESVEDYDSSVNDESYESLLKCASEEKVYLSKDPDQICECPRCKTRTSMEDFVDEFIETASETDNPCIFCGGEVVNIQSKETQGKSISRCEKCGSEIQH